MRHPQSNTSLLTEPGNFFPGCIYKYVAPTELNSGDPSSIFHLLSSNGGANASGATTAVIVAPVQTGYGAGTSRKKVAAPPAAGEVLVTSMPMTGTPLLTVTQFVEATFVALCKM